MIILNRKVAMYVLMKNLFGTENTLAQPPLLALAVHGISGPSPDSKKTLAQKAASQYAKAGSE